ncbi:MAG TPA: 3-oxoacyl-[acyl-carrier-protein] synthase III C-terminal domain-containing protein [Candidatus Deferrimicrobium sp.]|nr:3-oxoacyl-[acyl-carrier-protein] synthase III C-terminal domain-containing protein [Candidatus Deferrimicrobium sp.]
MPKVCAVTTAVPPHKITQAQAQEFARAVFGARIPNFDGTLQTFQNSGIETRYFSMPVEWFAKQHSFPEKNEAYLASAVELSGRAASDLLREARVEPSEIDYVIYVNTTGLATPSIDAHLINLLGLRPDVRRTPIWGLGCAGGAAGLSQAYHYALGHPDELVLVVAAELCGLTFMRDDYSKSNLVATALFGEGAAAVLIAGDENKADGLPVIATQSRFFPHSLDVMGWNVVSEGLQVVFAKRIPDIINQSAKDDFAHFLSKYNLTLDDISAFLFHPGGRKVLEAYQTTLGLSDDRMALSRDILRDYGNMSSVTVLFVLKRYLEQFGVGRGGYGLISALGPGFCSESLLIEL